MRKQKKLMKYLSFKTIATFNYTETYQESMKTSKIRKFLCKLKEKKIRFLKKCTQSIEILIESNC